VLTLSAVADRKKIELEKLEVKIDYANTENGSMASSYRVEIDLGAGLSKREKTLLFNSAKRCHVHKILSGESAFDYHLVESLACEKTSNPLRPHS
jgi:uncharacterized OsmC-like protein